MRLVETKLEGTWIVELEPLRDERGYFARCFCHREFSARGLHTQFVQASTAFTQSAGTLRGLHYQSHPHWETKLVRCTRGAAFVVVVDLRPESNNFREWLGVELSEETGRSLYVPVGCAQGYQTLVDNTELLYQMSTDYQPEAARGYRYDDPAFAIEWPRTPRHLSQRDLNWADYS